MSDLLMRLRPKDRCIASRAHRSRSAFSGECAIALASRRARHSHAHILAVCWLILPFHVSLIRAGLARNLRDFFGSLFCVARVGKCFSPRPRKSSHAGRLEKRHSFYFHCCWLKLGGKSCGRSNGDERRDALCKFREAVLQYTRILILATPSMA